MIANERLDVSSSFDTEYVIILSLRGAVRSADLKISKSATLSLNHHTFSNTEPIYTK